MHAYRVGRKREILSIYVCGRTHTSFCNNTLPLHIPGLDVNSQVNVRVVAAVVETEQEIDGTALFGRFSKSASKADADCQWQKFMFVSTTVMSSTQNE